MPHRQAPCDRDHLLVKILGSSTMITRAPAAPSSYLLCLCALNHITHANSAWSALLGVSARGLVGEGLGALLGGRELLAFERALSALRRARGEDQHVMTRLHKQDIHISWTLSANAAGEVFAWGTRVMEARERETGVSSAHLLDHLMEMQGDIFMILSPDTSILLVSEACEAALGLEADVLMGEPMSDFVHPQDLVRLVDALEQLVEHEYPEPLPVFEYRVRRIDAGWHPVLTTGKALKRDGQLQGFALLSRAMPLSPGSLETLFESSAGDDTRRSGPHGRVGWHMETLVRELEVMTREQAWALAAEDPLFGGVMEQVVTTQQPGLFQTEGRVCVVFSMDERLVGVLTVPNDLLSQGVEPPEVLLQLFDHELRTPLNTIRGYVELMLEEIEQQPALRHDLNKVYASTRELQRLLDNLVELTRLKHEDLDLHLEQVRLSDFVQEVRDHLRALEGVELAFTCSIEPGLSSLYTDRARLLDAMVQLLAFLAPRGERLRVEIRRDSPSRAHLIFGISGYRASVRTLREALTAELSLSQGFAQKGHLDVFMSARRFELLGGELTFLSGRADDEVRLRGCLPLPFMEMELSAGLGEAYESEASDGELIVLVVDEDEALHAQLSSWFARTPYQLEHAYDGVSGLSMARELAPALIIMDVVVPRLDGWSMMAEMRQDTLLARVPVVILSALEEEELALALGAKGLLGKPVSERDLMGAVEGFLLQPGEDTES